MTQEMDQEIISILRGVMDPELKENIVELGMVKEATREGNLAKVNLMSHEKWRHSKASKT